VLKENHVIDTTLSDEQGKYSLDLLENGEYTIRCHILGGYIHYNSKTDLHTTKTPAEGLQYSGKTLKVDFQFAPFQKGHWHSYTVVDGLVSLHINSINQDGNGSLWFAGNEGLAKYDGKSFSYLLVEITE